jgi:hypothetical protein
MPAATAPLLGFSLGVLFAWAAAQDLGRSTAGISGRSLLLVWTFALLVFAPVCAYFIAFEPDWSYAYLIDSQRLPSVVDIALVLFALLSVPLGFMVAAPSARSHRPTRVARIGGAPALIAVVVLMAGFSRLSVHATYAQYHGDFGTRGVAGGPLGYALIWMIGVLGMATLLTTRALHRLGRDH